jgi:hypothetical protein
VAASLVFGTTIWALWSTQAPQVRLLEGSITVSGRPEAALRPDLPFENTAPDRALVGLGRESTAELLPGSRAVWRRNPDRLELLAGKARFKSHGGSAPLRVDVSTRSITARASEFWVELLREPLKGESSMEPLLAILVSCWTGPVQVDWAGHSLLVPAGESRAIGADGTVAASLSDLLSPQDKDEKKGKDDDKEDDKGGKKEKGKKEGKEKQKKEKEGEKGEEKGEKKEKGKKDDDD